MLADGAMDPDVIPARGVPMFADAAFAEGVAAGDGYGASETLQAYGAGEM